MSTTRTTLSWIVIALLAPAVCFGACWALGLMFVFWAVTAMWIGFGLVYVAACCGLAPPDAATLRVVP